MSQIDTWSNCPAIPVTEKQSRIIPEIVAFNGCLVITVTENDAKLWSITLTGSEVFLPIRLRYEIDRSISNQLKTQDANSGVSAEVINFSL